MKEPKKTLDSALLQQARDGDREARSALYEATYQEVWRTVRSLIRSEDDALDVLQDTYVRAFTRLDQLKNPASVGPWLRTIAANTARSHLQKTKPLLFSDLGEDAGEVPEPPVTDTAALPEASLDQKETAALLRELLDSLSDGQRLVLSLHYYEDMPVREIARSLDVTESTVKTQLRDGRKRLEQKVRDLERRGVNLYGLSALPLFRTLMQKNAETLTPPLAASARVQAAATEAAGSSVPVKAVAAGSGLGRRILLGLGGLAVLGGIALGSWLLLRGAQKGSSTPTGPSQPALESSVPADSLDPSEAPEFSTLPGDELVAQSLARFDALQAWSFRIQSDIEWRVGTQESGPFYAEGEISFSPLVCHAKYILGTVPADGQENEDYTRASEDGDRLEVYYNQVSSRDSVRRWNQLFAPLGRLPNDFSALGLKYGYGFTDTYLIGNKSGSASLADFIYSWLHCGSGYTRRAAVTVNGRPAVCFFGKCQGEDLANLRKPSALSPFFPNPSDNMAYYTDPIWSSQIPLKLWIDAETLLPLRMELDFTKFGKWGLENCSPAVFQSLLQNSSGLSPDEIYTQYGSLVYYNRGVLTLDLFPSTGPVAFPETLPEN